MSDIAQYLLLEQVERKVQIQHCSILFVHRIQSNFHILYYFYDNMEATGKLKKYGLNPGRKQRYLRIGDKSMGSKRSFKVRNDPYGNSAKFEELRDMLKAMEMDDIFEILWNLIAAVINIGEIRFIDGADNSADVHNMEQTSKGETLPFLHLIKCNL